MANKKRGWAMKAKANIRKGPVLKMNSILIKVPRITKLLSTKKCLILFDISNPVLNRALISHLFKLNSFTC